MNVNEILAEEREEIIRLAARGSAYNVRPFGSVARGESDSESDVDILVDMESGRSLLRPWRSLVRYQRFLGSEVDVFTEDCPKSRVRKRAVREAVPLCETIGSACSIYLGHPGKMPGLLRN